MAGKVRLDDGTVMRSYTLTADDLGRLLLQLCVYGRAMKIAPESECPTKETK